MTLSKAEAWTIFGVVIFALILVGVFGVQQQPAPRPQPLNNLHIAEAWLRCIDCEGPFLRRISEMQGKSRDSVIEFLAGALHSGPDSVRTARHEAALRRSWLADSAYRSKLGTGIPPRDSMVGLYLRGFEVMWRSRAAMALRVIQD